MENSVTNTVLGSEYPLVQVDKSAGELGSVLPCLVSQKWLPKVEVTCFHVDVEGKENRHIKF